MSLLERLFPVRTISVDGDVYFRRYYVVGNYPAKYWPQPAARQRLPWLPFTVYLHRFERPDRDRALHNHPWRWAVSLCLRGGYVEERALPDGDTELRRLRPGRLNLIRHGAFHRILRLMGPCNWTLIITGPVVSRWGFRDLETGQYWDHAEFEARRAGGHR